MTQLASSSATSPAGNYTWWLGTWLWLTQDYWHSTTHQLAACSPHPAPSLHVAGRREGGKMRGKKGKGEGNLRRGVVRLELEPSCAVQLREEPPCDRSV
ncbi:hypothetical protein LSTR_LSTR001818 [Laodelphax striatellus]|uniref:Uncharacterized protein n=1 Tax=Laodelphax striatellus TaxID=195883 RepID=A0A482WFS7_LAOST|nr:hypothetical protein LSTR_LSTR001818 [Laodelphax striatellus]